MGRDAGRLQEILEGAEDTLSYAFLVDGVPQTPSAATVEIRSPGGSVLLAATSTGVSLASGLVTLTQTWTESTYPDECGYRAEWVITYNSTDYPRRQYFDVVLRHFESGLVDSDLTDMIPELSNQLESGQTFVKWRNAAWDRIYKMVRQHTKHSPSDFTRPELLFEAHRSLSLALFCRGIMRRDGDEWHVRMVDFFKEFANEFKMAMSWATIDEDRSKTEDTYTETRAQRFRNMGR